MKEFAPLRGFAATLDLAQKILAYTHASSGIVLADALSFADGTYYRAKAGCVGERNFHEILTVKRILDQYAQFDKKILMNLRFFYDELGITEKSLGP